MKNIFAISMLAFFAMAVAEGQVGVVHQAIQNNPPGNAPQTINSPMQFNSTNSGLNAYGTYSGLQENFTWNNSAPQLGGAVAYVSRQLNMTYAMPAQDAENNGTSYQGSTGGGGDQHNINIFSRGVNGGPAFVVKKTGRSDVQGLYVFLDSFGGSGQASAEGSAAVRVEMYQMPVTIGTVTYGASTGSIDIGATLSSGIAYNDGGYIIRIPAAGSSTLPQATLSSNAVYDSTLLGSYYTLTSPSVTITPSSAWGTVVQSSCTPRSSSAVPQSGQSLTCTITLGSGSGSFVSGGYISMAGPFIETQMPVTAVGAASGGSQSVTFTSRQAWDNANGNANGVIAMQGGTLAGKAMGATSAINTWPIVFPILGSLSNGNVYVANCTVFGCNNLTQNVPSALLQSGTAVTFFDSTEVIGTDGGIGGGLVPFHAQLPPNTIPWVTGDTAIGTPPAQYVANGVRVIMRQTTPTASNTIYNIVGGGGFNLIDQSTCAGCSVIPYPTQNGASYTAPAPAIVYASGQYQDGLFMAMPPAGGAALHMGGNFQTGQSHLYDVLSHSGAGSDLSGTLSYNAPTGYWQFNRQYNNAGLISNDIKVATIEAGLNTNNGGTTGIPATSGSINLTSPAQICWRNQANTGDVCISKSGDQLVVPGLPTVASSSTYSVPYYTGSSSLGGVSGSGVPIFSTTGAPTFTALSTFATATSVQNNSYTYAGDTGTANAYAIALSPTPSVVAGFTARVKVANSNTAGSTLAVNGTSYTVNKKTSSGLAALTGSELIAGQIYDFTYDGSVMEIAGSTLTASSLTGSVAIANGGTGATSAQAARNNLSTMNRFVPAWLQNLGTGANGSNTTASGNLSGEFNYVNFTVPFGNTVTVNNARGLVIHATGTCTIAGTVNARGQDALTNNKLGGGSGGGGGGGAASGSTGTSSMSPNGTALLTGGSPGAAGAAGSSGNTLAAGDQAAYSNSGAGFDGQLLGGAGGGGGGSAGGSGGLGGTAVVLICGSITGTDGTNTGTINVSGSAGNNSGANSTGSGGGGGGGVIILSSQAAIPTNPTLTVSGGAGGTCGSFTSCGAGGAGGAGWSSIYQNW